MIPEPVRVAITYHSETGHVAKLAAAVAEGIQRVDDGDPQLIDLTAMTSAAWVMLEAADAMVFGAPTYMGGPSAVFKSFAEATLPVWADKLRWRNKVAAGFTHSQALSGDKLHTLQYFTVLAGQHGMLWVTLDLYPSAHLNRLGAWLGVMSQSARDAPPDEAPPVGDLETARHLGRRVAEVTRQVRVGRQVLGAAGDTRE